MTTHRALQLSNLLDTLQANRVRYYNAARKAASLGNKGGMGYYMARAHKCSSILGRINARFGSANG